MMPASCLPRSVAHAQQIGQEILKIARQAQAEGRITQADWAQLPITPEGMLNLMASGGEQSQAMDVLLKILSDQRSAIQPGEDDRND